MVVVSPSVDGGSSVVVDAALLVVVESASLEISGDEVPG